MTNNASSEAVSGQLPDLGSCIPECLIAVNGGSAPDASIRFAGDVNGRHADGGPLDPSTDAR
ncbi:MAG: hypothetical protein AB1761_12295, partial [Pseudomonadota bacterium]